ncbi:MAG: Gfo/Idh/MocA family oxidoreductase [Planctomycetes bacterium]|nr:Gfo/Idh/MocA family oxidoreductase [Planctomycetota bacterium]
MKHAPIGLLLVAGRLTHQENYGRTFARDDRCRLVGLTDERGVGPERDRLNRELAADIGIPFLPVLEDALARPEVQAVCVCAEPERRGRILAECARAGKHIYIDKPMTPYLDTAREVVEAARRTGVFSQMFSLVTQPWARRAREVVHSGIIGNLVAVHADCLFAKGPSGTASLGRTRFQPYPPKGFTFVDSKPELYDIGVYAIGLALWLTGKTVKNVYGRTANYFFQEHQRNGVEDFGFLLLDLEGGVTATITGGRIGWSSHPAGGPSQVRLIGSRGSLAIDAYSPRIEVYGNEPPWQPPPVNPRDPMGMWSSTQREVDTRPKETWVTLPGDDSPHSDESCFLDCIFEGRKSEMDVERAAAITEAILAGYKSAATGEVVKLPL